MPKQPINSRKFILFSVIILTAFLLRIWDINARSLWFDEAVEFDTSQVPVHIIPQKVLNSFQPPLYNFVLHFWMFLGKSETWLRLLSVLFSLSGMVAMMMLSDQLAGTTGAIISGILLTIMPTEIRYAQEVAEYALMGCLLSWAVYILFKTYEKPTWAAWCTWALLGVLAVYTHYGAAIIIFSLTVVVFGENFISHNFNAMKKQAIISTAGILAGLPLFYFFPKQLSKMGGEGANHFSNILVELKFFIESALKTFFFPLTGWPYTKIPDWLQALGVGFIIFFPLAILPKLREESRRIVIWFWGSFVLYFIAVRAGIYAHGSIGFRYMLILSPLFSLLISISVSWLLTSKKRPAKIIGAIFFVCIISLSIYSLPNRTFSDIVRGDKGWPEVEEMGPVVSYWADYSSGKTPTYVYYGANPAFRYYLIRNPVTEGQIYYGKWFRSQPVEEKIRSIFADFGSHPETFWLIFSHVYSSEDQDILDKLSSEYSIQDQYMQSHAAAYLLSRK